jgi:lysozyme family protein
VSFDDALLETLHYEGGIANHPKDRGGLTNYGVTQKTYDATATA